MTQRDEREEREPNDEDKEHPVVLMDPPEKSNYATYFNRK